MSGRRTLRTRTRLTVAHLDRLAEIAAIDHEQFTADRLHPEYRDRRLLVVLAQGAAQHWVDGRHGVKDLDVWTFYADLPDVPFPGRRRIVHRDFGPSDLGRQAYPSASKVSSMRLHRWEKFTGRRVDLLMRTLPVPAGCPPRGAVAALVAWLSAGAERSRPDTAFWLSRQPAIGVDPRPLCGRVLWPGTAPEGGIGALIFRESKSSMSAPAKNAEWRI
jgi:hypothetical protein